jgi:hypothetical protein
MSSTNRGSKRSPADNYETPSWCAHRLLEHLPLPGGRWFEPAAGNGAIIEAINEMRSDILWSANELREECKDDLEKLEAEVSIGDFFDVPLEGRYDVIITNPPFRLAQQFVLKCLEHSDIVVMLLRVNFIGSAKRSKFMREHAPDVYTLPNRPSFMGGGKTDSPEYGWFVWHGTEKRRSGALAVLEDTPKDVRKAAHKLLEDRRLARTPVELPPADDEQRIVTGVPELDSALSEGIPVVDNPPPA